MKTIAKSAPLNVILVLTDFSRNAKNAADYGTQLAERLKANVLLFNSFHIPDPQFEKWPSVDYALLAQQSETFLKVETVRLNEAVKNNQGDFKPAIDYFSNEGTITENVCALIADKQNILMVVMGGCKANGNDDILFGDEIAQILHKVKVPTVIVPDAAYLPC